MTTTRVLALLCSLASLVAGANTLDVYGQLTGKTVLMASGPPRLPESIIADLPADKTNAVTGIEGASLWMTTASVWAA